MTQRLRCDAKNPDGGSTHSSGSGFTATAGELLREAQSGVVRAVADDAEGHVGRILPVHATDQNGAIVLDQREDASAEGGDASELLGLVLLSYLPGVRPTGLDRQELLFFLPEIRSWAEPLIVPRTASIRLVDDGVLLDSAPWL